MSGRRKKQSEKTKSQPKTRRPPKDKHYAKERERRIRTATETADILEHDLLQGKPIQHLIDLSVEGTRSYPESAVVPRPLKLKKDDDSVPTRFSVVNATTLAAAEALAKEYPHRRVAVLNFASAKNPGGGFLNGSMAQEESLALHSGLYACLKGDKMYSHHRTMKGGIYTDWCIFSPEVPVFRRESDGSLMEDPWTMSVVTSPCLSKSAMTRQSAMSENQLKAALRKRMLRFLAVLAAHHSGNVVLGAWGCGVFGNDPRVIAELFADLLCRHPSFRNRWPSVVFAVLDHTPKHSTINPFFDVFGGRLN